MDTPIDGFELLQKYLVKCYPDLNFSLLDIEEAKKGMLTLETGPANVLENLVLYPIQNTQWKQQSRIYFIHEK